jgi:hypothetical protein
MLNLHHFEVIKQYGIHLAMNRFELTILVVISTDCIGSCKSNYHTITTTPVAPVKSERTRTVFIRARLQFPFFILVSKFVSISYMSISSMCISEHIFAIVGMYVYVSVSDCSSMPNA